MMAEWLGDGYDETGSLEGYKFEYRPLPQNRQWGVSLRLMEHGPLDTGELSNEIQKRLIKTPIPEGWKDDHKKLVLLWRLVCGFSIKKELKRHARNLKAGVTLLESNPHFENFSCAQCRVWWVDITDGSVAKQDGIALRRNGKAPCEEGVTCPIGHWNHQDKRLSMKNQLAYDHFIECEISGQFPEDRMFLHNSRIIVKARDSVRKAQGARR